MKISHLENEDESDTSVKDPFPVAAESSAPQRRSRRRGNSSLANLDEKKLPPQKTKTPCGKLILEAIVEGES